MRRLLPIRQHKRLQNGGLLKWKEQRNGTGKQSRSSLPAVPFVLGYALSLLLSRNRVDRYIRSTKEIWDAPFCGVALKRFQRIDLGETLHNVPILDIRM